MTSQFVKTRAGIMIREKGQPTILVSLTFIFINWCLHTAQCQLAPLFIKDNFPISTTNAAHSKIAFDKQGTCLTLYLRQLIWKERFGGRKKTTVHNIEIRAGIRRRDVHRSRRGSTYYFSFLNLTFIFIDWCGYSVSWVSCSSKTISLWSNSILGIWWRNCRRGTGAAAPAGFQLSARSAKSLKQIFIRSVNTKYITTNSKFKYPKYYKCIVC